MPALKAVQIASTDGPNRDYIATLEPLIIQMYASSSVNVLDLDALDCTVLEDLGFSGSKITSLVVGGIENSAGRSGSRVFGVV
jgi:hypothetical protein